MSRGDIIVKTQDLTYLSWDECDAPSGLGGAAPKAREGIGANAVYYKRSRAGSLGQGNRDLLAELVGCRLLDALGIEHVPFQLVRARISCAEEPVWVAKSKSYRRPAERALRIDDFCELAGEVHETPLEFFVRSDWEKLAAQALLFDYLTATRDRDASCFEALVDARGNVRLSPLAPRASSLANAFPLDSWRHDPLADVGTTSYLGSPSLADSLSFATRVLGYVPKPRGLRARLMGSLESVFEDAAWLEGCCDIIERRWEEYARLCNL